MIISPSKNFIFIHLEKCGGTSIESTLEPYLHWSDMIIGSTEYGEKYQQNLYDRYGMNKVKSSMLWKHSPAKDIHAFLGNDGWNDFIKISIARNPIELFISLYKFSRMIIKYHVGRINKQTGNDFVRLNSFPNQWPYTEEYIQAYIYSEVNYYGINGFVDYLINIKNIKTQFERIEVNKSIDPGFIFDLSDIDNAWRNILELVDISNIPLKKLNASEPTQYDLSNKSIKKIKQHFALDYDMIPGYTGVRW